MNPSFYVLSSEDGSTDRSTPNTSLSSSSHDTSRVNYHVQDVTAFAEELDCAARNAFPNRGRSRYDSVNVCLIRWEEDELLVQPELARLRNVFQDYGFNTNVWEIPSRNSHLDLMIKTTEFIRSFDNDKNLFVIYYGGHGRIDSERQAEWTCKRDPSYARVHWSAIQTLFAEAMSDTLILLDTCAAASATTRSQYGSMEVIMASGFEARAPPPGEHSFTNTLVEVLESWINKRSFSASCLHAEILTELKMKPTRKGREGTKLEWCVTPIHLNCTQHSTAPSIELCRRNVLPRPRSHSSQPVLPGYSTTIVDAMDIDFDCTNSSQSPLSSLSPSGRFKTPHVLISVALEEDQPELDVKKTARWLESIPLLVRWARIESIFPSYSTLLVLSIPVPIWNMLPDHPACSFIGYVTAPNLVVSSTSTAPHEVRDEKKVKDDVKMEPILEENDTSILCQTPLSMSDTQICIDEIEDVDPAKSNGAISDFNRAWSSMNSPWPPTADVRVKSFMHSRNFYPLEDPDSQVLILLIEQLRKGTELEFCKANQYVSLMQRVAERASYLVKRLLNKALIEYDAAGTLRKSPTFKTYWEKRHEIWNDRSHIISPNRTRESSPTIGTSVVSYMNQQSVADSGYWTVGRRMDSIDSPIITISQWVDDSWKGGFEPERRESITGYPSPNPKEYISSPDSRDEDGSWGGGLAPEKRESIKDLEIPNLKDQEQQRSLEQKNMTVEEWRSVLPVAEFEEQDEDSYFDFGRKFGTRDTASGAIPYNEDNDIQPVDDAPSIHENRLQDGQVYFNSKLLSEVDSKLSSRPHHWKDPPTMPYATSTTLQPPTSNEAIGQWNREGDTLSLVSRAASWGTRRRSEPSLLDYNEEQGKGGNFLTLIISKIRGGRDGEKRRSSSVFDQIANIVRRRSDSNLKRSRSTQNSAEVKKEASSGSLAPPPRTSSFGRRPTPSINTALGAMSGTLAPVGTAHARSDSATSTANSPQSPTRLRVARPVIRVEGRSELESLLRGSGGPPVPTLTSPIKAEVDQPKAEPGCEDET